MADPITPLMHLVWRFENWMRKNSLEKDLRASQRLLGPEHSRTIDLMNRLVRFDVAG
jgi:hypothetical protein